MYTAQAITSEIARFTDKKRQASYHYNTSKEFLYVYFYCIKLCHKFFLLSICTVSYATIIETTPINCDARLT